MPNGEHFYTTDAAERDRAIRETTFESEGIGCYVLHSPPSGLSPLYRAYNGGHFYTTNFSERNTAIGNGYSPEGITAYVNTSPGAGLVPVHRFVNQAGRHFYTTNAAEASKVQHLGYRAEGTPFNVYSTQQPGTTPLYRLYLGKNDDHFYTTSAAERDHAIQKLGFANEGSLGYVHLSDPTGTEPFYRMRSDKGHFYTVSLDEFDKVAKEGWVREGIACYVYSAAGANRTPLYRLYRNDIGDHFYTIHANERDTAVAHLKYRYEGVAGYVTSGPLPGMIPFYRLLATDVSRHVLPFVPSRDGFAFRNDWKWDAVDKQKVNKILQAAVPAVLGALGPLLVPAFGVVDALGLLVGIPPGTVEVATLIAAASGGLGKIVDKALTGDFGLCGGMAFASLDYYEQRLVVNRGDPGAGFEHTSPEASALRDHIWNRLVDSYTGGVALQTLEWMALLHFIPESVGGGAKGLRDRTHSSWDQLKRVIKSGRPCPITLIGTTSNPSDNHQILAYGYEDHGNGKGRLYVYDNNTPDVESTIDLDFNSSPLGAKESSGSAARGPLRGFFPAHYTPKMPPLAVGLAKNFEHANQQLTVEVANIGLGPTPLLDITAVAVDRSTRYDLKPQAADPEPIPSRVTAAGALTHKVTTRTFTIPIPPGIAPDTWTIEVEARVSQKGVPEEVRQLPAATAGVAVKAAMHLP